MYSDYNDDGKLNNIDCAIFNAYLAAKDKYSREPTVEETQQEYNMLFVDSGKAPMTIIVSLPDINYSDFNNDSKINDIDHTIYNAYLAAKIIYLPSPTIENVQERYNTLYVANGKAPVTTIVSIPTK